MLFMSKAVSVAKTQLTGRCDVGRLATEPEPPWDVGVSARCTSFAHTHLHITLSGLSTKLNAQHITHSIAQHQVEQRVVLRNAT